MEPTPKNRVKNGQNHKIKPKNKIRFVDQFKELQELNPKQSLNAFAKGIAKVQPSTFRNWIAAYDKMKKNVESGGKNL